MERSLEIASVPDNLRIVEKLIDDISAKHEFESDMYGKVLVACVEAVNNSIIHGNKSNPDKKVKVVVKSSKDKLYITVEDEGPGFNFENIPDPTAPENIENINGRGVFLMSHLSDEVKFHNDGSKVELVFNLY
ncbi:MAG: ATP-binding protein [Bacteroidetes bacterium]|nr:MAG: ATP-binding protein [Bacteroidota bacterium]